MENKFIIFNKILKDNGLIYNKLIERTPIYDPAKRGEQILDCLDDKSNFDFIIIEDEMFDYRKFFNQDKIIKCKMFHFALSIPMVNNFLSKITNHGVFEEKNLTYISNHEDLTCDRR